MAKGQKKSNREAKKPKQVKPKATEQSSLTSRLTGAQDRPKGGKK